MEQYDKILKREETDNYNAIDKARNLLETLLDDTDVLLGNGAGEVVEAAISLIR